MKVLFFGSSSFSLPFLKHLFQHRIASVCGVITTPPAPKGRGRILQPTCIEEFARAKGLKVYPQKRLKDEEFLNSAKELQPDLLMAASYGKLIPEALLALTPYPLNIHPSLLPQYRGPNPILAPLLEGAAEAGVTVMRMTNEMDAGDIALQDKVSVDTNDTAGSLEKKLVKCGIRLLDQCLESLKNRTLAFTPQKNEAATFTQKTEKQHTELNWEMPLFEIDRRIRAYLPLPRAYFNFRDKKVFIEEGHLISTKDNPHKMPVIQELNKSDGSLTLTTLTGNYSIGRLAAEGKRSMRAYDFVQGYRLKVGDSFC